MAKPAFGNFIHALIAVLVGNIVYFLAMPYLPPAARHAPQQLDVGLLVDFVVCLLVLGLVKMIARFCSRPEMP